jgi:hypothetical protein
MIKSYSISAYILNLKDAEIIETEFMKPLLLQHIIFGKIIFDAII